MDDLLGNPLVFGYRKDNFVNNIIIKHRHNARELLPINLILISQNFKSVSTIVRKNIDIFVLLKNANKQKLIENISQEVGGVIGAKDVEKLYDYATSFPFGSLIINLHPKETIRFRRGWSHEIKLEDTTPCNCESKGLKKYSCGKTA
jgi:alpha-L-fucosidase